MKKLVRDKIPEFATYASYRQLKPCLLYTSDAADD